jgi:hypothetical protein
MWRSSERDVTRTDERQALSGDTIRRELLETSPAAEMSSLPQAGVALAIGTPKVSHHTSTVQAPGVTSRPAGTS